MEDLREHTWDVVGARCGLEEHTGSWDVILEDVILEGNFGCIGGECWI
jgi:hypothetical protein